MRIGAIFNRLLPTKKAMAKQSGWKHSLTQLMQRIHKLVVPIFKSLWEEADKIACTIGAICGGLLIWRSRIPDTC